MDFDILDWMLFEYGNIEFVYFFVFDGSLLLMYDDGFGCEEDDGYINCDMVFVNLSWIDFEILVCILFFGLDICLGCFVIVGNSIYVIHVG